MIVVIPARGGSKRIIGKNKKNFGASPIIQGTIKKLISFEIFEKIIVSTDDLEIELIQKMDQLKIISKDWMYKNILNFTFEEAELQREALKDDAKLTFVLNNLEQTGTEKPQDQQGMLGQQPALGSDEEGNPMDVQQGEEVPEEEPQPEGQPLDIEDQLSSLEKELGMDGEVEESAKPVGRPSSHTTYGKDKSPFGRDPLGKKDWKNQSKNENFIDMIKKSIKKDGKQIIREGNSMMDEQNIIEN